jgi:hypothetical protein
MIEATSNGPLLSEACVPRGGKVESNIRAIITLVDFCALSVALEITRGAEESELVPGGFVLVSDGPFAV